MYFAQADYKTRFMCLVKDSKTITKAWMTPVCNAAIEMNATIPYKYIFKGRLDTDTFCIVCAVRRFYKYLEKKNKK